MGRIKTTDRLVGHFAELPFELHQLCGAPAQSNHSFYEPRKIFYKSKYIFDSDPWQTVALNYIC